MIAVDQEAVANLAEQVKAALEGAGDKIPGAEEEERVVFPLKFEDVTEEVNIAAVGALLDFGRGFRDVVEKENERGLEETKNFGVIHMHISGKKLDQDHLRSVTAFSVTDHFNLKGVRAEKEIMGGVYQDTDGPLKPYADLLVQTLNTTGNELFSLQKDSLGQYIVEKLEANVPCTEIVSKLDENFQGFKDQVKLSQSSDSDPDATSVLRIDRKAVLLMRELYDKFQTEEPKRYTESMKNIDDLPYAIDDEIMGLLIGENVLQGVNVEKEYSGTDPQVNEIRAACQNVMNDLGALVPDLKKRGLESMLRKLAKDSPQKKNLRVTGTLHL